MRYFELALMSTTDEIKERATINLREYGYNCPVASLNNYMCKSLNTGFSFFAYRETTEGLILSAFSYDERKHPYPEACQYILDILNDAFSIRNILDSPSEITMFQFFEYLQEARRRDLINFSASIFDTANLYVSGHFIGNLESCGYALTEKIVSPSDEQPTALYDRSLQNELLNIVSHKNNSGFKGNMVHYVLSCHSVEAACDMTEKLVQHLAVANRVISIDEAYSLCDGYENGFGDEAITTIVQEMENHRDNVIVIFAGYPTQMKQFLNRNPGLSSRIAFHVNFENYTTDELCAITKLMLGKKHMDITDAAMNKLRECYANVSNSADFGNGRFARKLLEEAEMNLAERLLKRNVSELTKRIVTTIEEEDIPDVPSQGKAKQQIPLGFSVPV